MGFINIIKATRVQRTLTALATMMVPVAFAGTINKEVIYLAIVCILMYGVAAIQNAKKDNDYVLPKNYLLFSGILIGIAITISLRNYIVFFTFLAWTFLGIFYNNIARYFLFGDVTVLSVTHHTIPTVSASLLVGLTWKQTMILSLFMFITFWFIIHLKNIKDTKDDKKRGYRTLTTDFDDGNSHTKLLFEFSFLCMFLAYFILDLSKMYLYILISVLLLKIFIGYFVDLSKHTTALNLTRFMAIVFLAAIIIDKSHDRQILMISSMIGLAYLTFLGIDITTGVRNEDPDD